MQENFTGGEKKLLKTLKKKYFHYNLMMNLKNDRLVKNLMKKNPLKNQQKLM